MKRGKIIVRIVLLVAFTILLIFIVARQGWRLFGFSFCQDAVVKEVTIQKDSVEIKGTNLDSSLKHYIGYLTKWEDGKLYIGIKYNKFLGILPSDTDSFDILIKTREKIESIYIKTGDTERKVWSREDSEQEPVESSPQPNIEPTIEPTTEPTPPESISLIHPEGNTLESRIATPEGYKRVAADADSLATFLRSYEMKEDQSPVLLYDGSEKVNQVAHVAVFKLPIENRDLQQCADSIMRVYAEYYWSQKKYNKIAFHFTNGFMASYKKWQSGYRIKVNGNSVSWVKSASYDASYECLQKYLKMVFCYAGTMSMDRESEPTTLKELKVGDVFIKGGSPGHVVMVVDICENSKGEKAFLLAQGYMPAQEFHVLKNEAREGDPWYYEGEVTYPFRTPQYTFEEGSLRKLTYQ